MIILVDNKNYMIRLCKDSKTIHGFDVTYPNWKGMTRLYSDMGFTVVLNGKEAEKWLDENNIYYIHMEFVKKESFKRFSKRLSRTLKEHEELLKKNNSTEKLIFGLSTNLKETNDIHDTLLFSITRDNKTGDYFVRYSCNLTTRDEKLNFFKEMLRRVEDKFGYNYIYGIEEEDFYRDINFSTGKSLHEVVAKLQMFIAVLEASK